MRNMAREPNSPTTNYPGVLGVKGIVRVVGGLMASGVHGLARRGIAWYARILNDYASTPKSGACVCVCPLRREQFTVSIIYFIYP